MMSRAELRWRCRRGMRELDLLLDAFLASGYDDLDSRGRADFERLLACPDQTLHDWLLGLSAVTEKDLAHVVDAVRSAT